MPRSKRSQSLLSGLFTENLGLKGAALALSLLLFSLVHSDVDAQRTVQVDVVALLPPPGAAKMLVSELPPYVKVTLRGSRSRISALSSDELPPIQVDLRDGEAGYYYFEPSAIEVGGNVQVVDISPPTVPLTWAVSAERKVPVQARVGGALAKGLSLREPIAVVPGRVTLRGPQPKVARLDSVSTEEIMLESLGLGTHTRRMPLQALPEYVTYVEDVAAEVTLVIEPIIAERSLKRLDVAAVGPGTVALRPERVTVTLRGPQDLLTELDPEGVVPYVELDPELGPATAPHEVKVRGVPESIELVGVVPASVLVRRKGGN
jgi:YbbR domain-containing protein